MIFFGIPTWRPKIFVIGVNVLHIPYAKVWFCIEKRNTKFSGDKAGLKRIRPFWRSTDPRGRPLRSHCHCDHYIHTYRPSVLPFKISQNKAYFKWKYWSLQAAPGIGRVGRMDHSQLLSLCCFVFVFLDPIFFATATILFLITAGASRKWISLFQGCQVAYLFLKNFIWW